MCVFAVWKNVASFNVGSSYGENELVSECQFPKCQLPECQLPECQLPECQLPKCQLPKMSTHTIPTPKTSTFNFFFFFRIASVLFCN